MSNQEIETYLLEFREPIREDGGDFTIIKIEDNFITLKIRGKKNKEKFRKGLQDLIQYAVNKQFSPKERVYRVIKIDWIVNDEEVGIINKIKRMIGVK